MLIVDGHLDLAWNALFYGRDLTRPVVEIRATEEGMVEPGRGGGTVSLPEMRRGRVALCFATVLARSTGTPVRDLDYPSVAQALASTRGQLAYYRALEAMGELRVIEDREALDEHLVAWEACDEAGECDEAPVGVVINMEGADSIASPEAVEEWHAAGLRMIGPAHFGPGRYAGGTGTELGLTDLGFALLDAMHAVGMGLDLAHLADPAFWQALDHFEGPVIASHCNCRALVPGQRQLSDEQIQAIVARGGVIGAVVDNWMLKPGFVRRKDTNEGIFLKHVVDHIDHVCQVAGNANHAAIGSDLDGLFGLEQSPCDMDSIVDLQRIAGMLAERGYGEEDVAKIMHGNWIDAAVRVV
jgi:membrane dipeptidase